MVGPQWFLSLKGLGGVRSATVCPGNGARGCNSGRSRGPTGTPAPSSQLQELSPRGHLVPEWLQLKCSVLHLISSNYTEAGESRALMTARAEAECMRVLKALRFSFIIESLVDSLAQNSVLKKKSN